MNVIGSVGLGIILFASTNVDDLLVLIAFFALPRCRARDVVIGQYLGIGALIVVSVVLSLISLVLSPPMSGCSVCCRC